MEMCISYLDTQSAYVPNHELMFVGQLMKDRNVTMQFSITATVQYNTYMYFLVGRTAARSCLVPVTPSFTKYRIKSSLEEEDLPTYQVIC